MSTRGARQAGLRREKGREREREKERENPWEPGARAYLPCPPMYLMQPLLKIELYFAERTSNDTHQMPINSSKW